MFENMQPAVRAILLFAIAFVVMLASDYFFDVIVNHEPFTPSWFLNTVIAGVLTGMEFRRTA